MWSRWYFLFLACIFLTTQALADLPRELFIVEGVPVDVSSASAVRAREAAIATAESLAARLLMRRFVPEADLPKAEGFAQGEVERLVASVEVAEEKTAGNRYVGRITVVFRPEEVRRRLKVLGVPYSLTLARPALIVPQTGENDKDWAPAWRAAFQRLPHNARLQGLVLAEGETENLAAAAEAQRAFEAATAKLTIDPGEGSSPAGVSIGFQLYGQPVADPAAANFAPSGPAMVFHVAREPSDSNETLLMRAAAMVMDRVNEPWKRATAEAVALQTTIQARANFGSFADWLAIREVLASTPAVAKIDVVDLSVGSAGLALTVAGSPDKLAFALAQRDVKLQTESQPWKLTRMTK